MKSACLALTAPSAVSAAGAAEKVTLRAALDEGERVAGALPGCMLA